MAPSNWVKAFGASKRVVVSGWAALGSPIATEVMAATVPFDAVTLDLQHGTSTTIENLYPLLQALGSSGVGGYSAGGIVPIVRAAENDAASLGYILDAGARGVIMPLINCAADAEAFVAAARYPPYGTRSFGPFRANMMHRLHLRFRDQHNGGRLGGREGRGESGAVTEADVEDEFDTSEDSPPEAVRMAMIETTGGLDAVEDIAAVDGIDALFVGPYGKTRKAGGAPESPAENFSPYQNNRTFLSFFLSFFL